MSENSFQQLDAAISGAQESADLIASHIRSDTTRTNEGKSESYELSTAEHRDHLQALAENVDSIIPAAQAQAEQVRAQIMPTPTDDTGTLAAELQAQRIMGRKGMDDPRKVVQWIQDSEPSTARTTVINEAVARGVLDPETVDDILSQSSPEYGDARLQVMHAQGLVNGVYKPRLGALSRRLGEKGWAAGGPDMTEDHRSTIYEEIKPLQIGQVRRWSPTRDENLYRNRR